MAMVFVFCGLIIVEVFLNRIASGLQLDSRYQFDLIDGLRIYNNTYAGLSVVEGIHHFSPAVLLQGETRHLQIPIDMYTKISELLSRTNELTFLATLKQEEKNSGTIISFSDGNERFLELQSSGRKNEIRLHYTHKNDTHVETFPYHLADSNWHQIALTISGNTIDFFVDCNRIYKRIIYDLDQDFATRNISLWLGQRNSKHFLFKGCLQDVKIIGHSHGFVLQCPHLDTYCPTCGQFKQLQLSVLQLESHIKELNQRLAHAEQHISQLQECECQKNCIVNGSSYADGSTWKRGCEICSCVHGEVKRRPVSCASVQCKNPVHVPGECCPVCLRKCRLDNLSYDHGEKDIVKCIPCECRDGTMHCHRDKRIECLPLPCNVKEQFNVPGECCPLCPGVDFCGEGHDCHHNASCQNLKTQYTCQCNRGFSGDGRSCQDINECLTVGGHNGHHCRLNTQCTNIPGGYKCECNAGYKKLDAYNCFEHDECITDEHECHEHARCINTVGSYGCQCLDGYDGDGFTCEPVCSDSCLNGGECIAPDTCSCRYGYSGSSCEIDVDECSLNLHNCHANSQCVNMPGWHYCQCRPGYESHPEDNLGAFCQDADECLIGSHTCHISSTCVNEEGSFRCECIDMKNNSCSLNCLYYGEERLHGESWSTDSCTKCQCYEGVVACQPVECDCTKSNTNYECCPHCDHTSVCQHQETEISYRNGDKWIYQCQICECLHGEIDCWEMECPPLTCDVPFRNPGDCCPRCENDPCSVTYNSNSSEPKGCSYNGHIYQAGEKVPLLQDPCSSCQCQVSYCHHTVSNTGSSFHRMGSSVVCLLLVKAATVSFFNTLEVGMIVLNVLLSRMTLMKMKRKQPLIPVVTLPMIRQIPSSRKAEVTCYVHCYSPERTQCKKITRNHIPMKKMTMYPRLNTRA